MSVTLLVDKLTIDKMARFYEGEISSSPSEHVLLFISNKEYSINIYKKEKEGLHKALFQGKQAAHEAAIWGKPIDKKQQKRIPLNWENGQIGSDEVGTGDFFGPIVVVACYVKKSDLPRLKELGVTDSKALDDKKIKQIGPILVKEFSYSCLTLDNEKYNDVHNKGMNMVEIKAKMHNRALFNVRCKHPKAQVTIDQFVAEKSYYRYLQGEKEVVKDIVFSTKGELAFPSVATSSCIARYCFLKHMEILSKQLGEEIPLGAGGKVDEFASRKAKQIGKENLRKYLKENFKNFAKLD